MPDNSRAQKSVEPVIVHRSLRRRQVIHARALLIGPILGTAVLLLLVMSPRSLVRYPTRFEWAVFFIAYVATMLGVGVGLHRFFSHGSFRTSRVFTAILAVLGMSAAQGPLLLWVANHRRHHQLTDRDGDPHSPHVNAGDYRSICSRLWHAHVGWMSSHSPASPLFYAPELVRDRMLLRLNHHYAFWVLGGIALPVVLCGLASWSFEGVLYGLLLCGAARLLLVTHLTFIVNSLGHFAGPRPHPTKDHSRNLWWLSIPTLGESYHNNHHADQASACFSNKPSELDLGWVLIWCLEMCGIVWRVRRLTRRQ